MNIKNIVYVTQAQYDTLVNGGSIIVEGVTYTYDEANVYAVKETIDTTPTQNSDNLITSGGVYDAIHSIIPDTSNLDNTKTYVFKIVNGTMTWIQE